MVKIVYKHHKQIDNALHKAAFRGKVDQINSLLNHISPYKTTSQAETPLHLSLAKGHQDAANIFLNILEIDLIAARGVLREDQVEFELDNENFVLALGKRQIEMVNESCSDMVLTLENRQKSSIDKCSIIVMKENIYSTPDVLVLRANDEAQQFALFSTIFHLMKENGVISLNVQRSSDHSTVLHLAAARGLTAMVMRLLDLGANPHLQDKDRHTAISSAHSMGEFYTYVEMCRRLNLNMLASKDFLRLPVHNAVWEKVEFLIETLVTLRMDNYQERRDEAMKTVLSINEMTGTFLLSNIGEKCLENYGEYLPQKELARILTLLVNSSHTYASILRNRLRKSSFVKQKTSRVIQKRTHNTVLHNFVRNGRIDIVRRIYDEFPPLKTLLFEHKEIGLSALIQCIQSNHIELAEFLIQEHEDEINHPQQWSQLLIAVAGLPESMAFMKLILEHPMTDPNMVLDGAQSIQKNALFACISKANLEKVKTILESSKMTDLNIIQSDYETLLQSAIYSMNSSTTPFRAAYSGNNGRSDQYKYLTNDLDTSEDESEPLLYQPIETSHENTANKYEKMNKIFDLLIEMGANVKHVDKSHKTLLHHAVAKSNNYVVERLISLGLDPIDPDQDGNLAFHFVCNIEIFNILKTHRSFEQTITARLKSGAGILHHYLRSANVSVDLCSKLIDYIDVNALDDSGNTPLVHLAINPAAYSVCEFLVNNNANVNLKNSDGFTALHIAISHENFDIAALLIRQPTFDLFTLTNSGKSYLALLTYIADCKFYKLKMALDTRKEDLNRLIELYCNEANDEGFPNLFHATNNKYLLDLLITQPHIEVSVDKSEYIDLLLHKVRDNVEFAKFLVDHGLDVNKIDRFYQTPLTQALTANHGENVEVVKYLIEAGANVNHKTWQGNTPLHEACLHFDLETIKILLEAEADYNAKDCKGETPFDRLPIEYRSIIANILVR